MTESRFHLVFDDVMVKQLRKAAKNNQIKQILTKMLDKVEESGPDAGKLLDSKLFIFEMKTSEAEQQKTIDRIRKKASES